MSVKKVEFKKAFRSKKLRKKSEESFDKECYKDRLQNVYLDGINSEEKIREDNVRKVKRVRSVDEKIHLLSRVMKSLNQNIMQHVNTLSTHFRSEAPTSSKPQTSKESGSIDYDVDFNRNSRLLTKSLDRSRVKGEWLKNSKLPSALTSMTLADIVEGQKVEMKEKVKVERRVVTLRVVSLKVGVIDSIHDRFSAELLVRTWWREPSLDYIPATRKKKSGDGDGWNAMLTLENAIGEAIVSREGSVVHDARGRGSRVEVIKVSGQFFEFMELNRFPFDSQDLTVSLVSEHSEDCVELVVEGQCCMNSQVFISEQEWSLNRVVTLSNKTIAKMVEEERVICPVVCVTVVACRKPQFFMWNVILIMIAICSLAFTTFMVNLEYPHSRLQLAFILLLTTVTFKFVVNKCLPKISYLTYLDKYILGSMVILCGVCVWHAVVGSVIYRNLPKMSTTTISTPSLTNNVSHVSQIILSITDLVPLWKSAVNSSGEIGTGASSESLDSILTNCNASITTSVRGKPLPPGATCLLIDKVALVSLASAYVTFHVVFLVFIKSKND